MAAPQPKPKAAELLALLPASPDAYPQNLDLVRELVLAVRMDEAAYRGASFLDDRILSPGMQGAWLPAASVSAAAGRVAHPRPLHFIFHTGHVGSTLLSRLLDETGVVLPLREPLPLRVLADAHDVLASPESLLAAPQFEALMETLLRLWSRGYERTRAVVVKATSAAARIAVPLLGARPESRTVYLNLRAEPYLATLLAGANSPVDLRGHGPSRIRRLLARQSVTLAPLHALSMGELAALGWLVESLSCQDALAAHPARVLPLDFDEFMADVPGQLARVLAHFGLSAGPGDLARIVQSPVLQRYSKAPELPFAPG
ncbi:MAG: hypothetical protein ACREU4_11205, partial [Burkholderiales bacterium]